MRLSRPPAQPPGGNVVPALRIGDGPWPAAADRRGSVAQVVVQLMIPPGQLVHLRLPDGPGIQTGMRRRDGLVPQAVEDRHLRTGRQARAAAARRPELTGGPAALAGERGGDQHDRPRALSPAAAQPAQ